MYCVKQKEVFFCFFVLLRNTYFPTTLNMLVVESEMLATETGMGKFIPDNNCAAILDLNP